MICLDVCAEISTVSLADKFRGSSQCNGRQMSNCTQCGITKVRVSERERNSFLLIHKDSPQVLKASWYFTV